MSGGVPDPAVIEPRAAEAGAPSGGGASGPRTRASLTSPRLPRRSRLLINLVTVVVTVLFSYIALSGINFSEVSRALRTSDYLWLIPALIAFGLGSVARGLRWRSLFAPGRRPPRGPVLNATMIGYFYNSILPARAGEAARVLVLNQRSTTAAVEIVGTVVIERLYDLVTILLIFFAAEPWLPHVSWFAAAAVAAVVLAILIVAAVVVLALYGDRFLRMLLWPLRRFSAFSGTRLDRTVDELRHGLTGLRHGVVALEAFFWTVAAWMFSALCAYFVSVAFHLHLSFACGVLVVVAVGLSMILPSPPGAIGVFEGAALIALKAYGVPHSEALPYALVLHAVNLVPYILAGVVLLHYNSRHPGPKGALSLEVPEGAG
jgi:uncharacterized protein (TIRG00374 family)